MGRESPAAVDHTWQLSHLAFLQLYTLLSDLKKSASRTAPKARMVDEKLGRFEGETTPIFVPESIEWTAYMSRPGTKISIREMGQDFPRPV